jgi:hypothetical protein
LACVIALAAACIVAAGGAEAASAKPRLSVPLAKDKSGDFAARTCSHDENCVRSGVLNCRRERRLVVFCRIFVRRDTAHQGRYACNRLIRVSLPARQRPRVTGIGGWHC